MQGQWQGFPGFNTDQFTLLVYEQDQGSMDTGALMSLNRNDTGTDSSFLWQYNHFYDNTATGAQGFHGEWARAHSAGRGGGQAMAEGAHTIHNPTTPRPAHPPTPPHLSPL